MIMCVFYPSYDFVADARVRCDLIDLYYTLFGTRKPLCMLDENQQNEEVTSRRKSALTMREGVDEFKKVNSLLLAIICE